MAIQVQKYLISVADYHKMHEVGILPERGVELINGEIIEMSPIGSKHASIVDRLNRLLSKKLSEGVILRIQNPIILDDFSEPEPDLAIVTFKENFYADKHPQGQDALLIIEVSDTSIAYDRQVKLPIYAQSGIPECWLIDARNGEIHAYWEPLGNTYRFSQLARKGDALSARQVELAIFAEQILG